MKPFLILSALLTVFVGIESRCSNKASNCASFRRGGQCSESLYRSFAKKYCSSECGFCLPSPCKDKSKRCARLVANGFCTSYDEATKIMMCPRSCGLCPKNKPKKSPPISKPGEKDANSPTITSARDAALKSSADLTKLGSNLAGMADGISQLSAALNSGGPDLVQQRLRSVGDNKAVKSFAQGSLFSSVMVDLGVDSIDAVVEAFEANGKTHGWKIYIDKTSQDFDSFKADATRVTNDIKNIASSLTKSKGSGSKPSLITSIVNTVKDVEKGATDLSNMKENFEKAVAHAFVDGIIDLAEAIGGKSLRKTKSSPATIEKVKQKLDNVVKEVNNIKKSIEELSKSFKTVTDSLNNIADKFNELTKGLGIPIEVPKVPNIPGF